MNTENFYGQDCVRSPGYASDATGVVFGNVRMQKSAYETGRRIHAAGSDGEAVGRASRTDLQMLETAGITVRSNPNGTRVYIDRFSEPDAWLTPVSQEPSRRGKLTGPFGGALEPTGPGYRGDRNVTPQPWR